MDSYCQKHKTEFIQYYNFNNVQGNNICKKCYEETVKFNKNKQFINDYNI